MFEITNKPKNKIIIEESLIEKLNAKYNTLSVSDRFKQLYKYFDVKDVMLTSFFAATSALLLKFVSEINKAQTVFFIDTGYHFEETIQYKKLLTKKYGLNVKSIKALENEHNFTKTDKTWTKNPDLCCNINKVRPFELIKTHYKVWVSGLMKWQSDHRASLNIFELRGDILKFYPLLDVTKKKRDALIAQYHLPFHPLVAQGYQSIGCTHCTVAGEDRSGRWNNNPKTECGLHL